MADRTLGGKFFVNAAGARYEIIGELTIDPTNEKREAKSTSSGKMYRTVEAKPYKAKAKFARFIDGDPLTFWNLPDQFDVTFVETSRTPEVRHLFTNASAVGEPSMNLMTGEMDGIELATDTYLQTTD